MTTQIQLSNIQKHYGSYHALKNINLSVEQGSFVALVGPSGCGKSTLLRTLAGLESITSGDLRIAGDLMNNVPPRKRDIAMVFQSYALYPHMTVEENLAYSLRIRGVGKEEIRKKTDAAAETTGLTELLKRYPRELSGGQRQRVAMGRAIIRNPKAFLFDEPLSNLDASLRVQMRKEIRALHDRLQATFVYVTHDQIEAMTMADKIVLMREGIIEQEGAPMELYDKPVNKFVASFIGSPAMNFVDGVIGDNGSSVILDLEGQPTLELHQHCDPGSQVTVGLRPEFLQIVPSGTPGAFALKIGIVERTGASSYVASETEPAMIVASNERITDNPGDIIHVRIDSAKLHLFSKETGLAVR